MHASVEIVERLLRTPLAELRIKTVDGAERRFSFGHESTVELQAEALRREFAGQSELLLYHAILMMLLRRRIDIAANVERARELWQSEPQFLVANLDSRWLVSACDTIIDHWHEPEERALALAGTLFANTVKLYETERWATWRYGTPLPEAAPRFERVALHDGMSAFMIGTGDMVANLHRRLKAVCAGGSAAALIVSELVKRASEHETVLKRLRDVHIDPNTMW